MTKIKSQDRQNLEILCWPELMQKFQPLVELVMVSPTNLSRQLRAELFTMASIAGGCQHCQAHGGYSLHLMGVDTGTDIRDIWTFEQSAEFVEAEKAALRLARDGALVPNMVTPGHFADLRRHFSDRQIVEMLARDQSGRLVQPLEQFDCNRDGSGVGGSAEANLKTVGWVLDKHAGAVSAQRRKHPRSTDPNRIEY